MLIETACASRRRAELTTVALAPSTEAVHEPVNPTQAAVAASVASVCTLAGWLRSTESATSRITSVVSLTVTTTVADSLAGTVAVTVICTALASPTGEVVRMSPVLTATCT